MSLIAFSGKAGSGKDTAAQLLQYIDLKVKYPNIWGEKDFKYFLSKEHSWVSDFEIHKFAFEVKLFISRITGCTLEQLEDQDFKKSKLPPIWDYLDKLPFDNDQGKLVSMTVRDMLIRVGNGMREVVHEDIWVNALLTKYKAGTNYPDWVISDLRYVNEKNRIEYLNGICIRIEREGLQLIDHPSETSLDHSNFRHIIHNNGSLVDLESQIFQIYKKIGL